MEIHDFLLYLPDSHETYCLVALEAMSRGCVPIVRNYSGLGELVSSNGGDDSLGLLIDGNPNEEIFK